MSWKERVTQVVFSSYIFLLAFLPVVLVGYYLLSRLENPLWQKVFLIAASLFFYGYYNVKYLALIVGSMMGNYVIALLMQGCERSGKAGVKKVLLTIGVLFNVALIGYFKYFDFFISNVNAVFNTGFGLRHIALPLGISFFTFQQLSFLISIYKQEEKVENICDYSLFVTFFPQLVAGPIVLYSEMIPQFRDESRRRFNVDNFTAGLYIFIIGMFKKAVVADTLDLFVGNGFDIADHRMIQAWITALSYTLQIYFDFSGYSDMAIGLGRMFNINLPFNFLSPYKSESITEFWRRWHITLGRALSSYIYKPLGGNRKGKARTCINLFLTFMVSGLWHGAAWTFVLWGALHGLIMVVERLAANFLKKIPHWIRVAVTFVEVNFLWVLFRAEEFSDAANVYRGMFNFRNIGFRSLSVLADDGLVHVPALWNAAYILLLVIAGLLVVFKCKNSAYRLENFQPKRSNMVFAVVLFTVSLICMTRESVFIYFNF